ncbi:hypothetical protein CKY51_04490 [Xanthomonas maliensis]|nr:hypothetical protein CKY51_04490 [Xanthomonas maliensis]
MGWIGWWVIAVPQLGRAEPPQTADCSYDHAAMLALDENAFDQDMQGGWRVVADRPGCALAAAELLRDYRQAHAITGGIVTWHEGQMRAQAGQSAQAIALFDQARKPAEQDLAGWNPYVDATIAFLKRDRAGLQAARARLAAVPYPAGEGMPPLKDGVIVWPAESGRPEISMRWPPNLDVVDGLRTCYEESYAVAYGSERCRTATSTSSDAKAR